MDKYVYVADYLFDNGCRVEERYKVIISKRQLLVEEVHELIRNHHNGYDETVYNISVSPVTFFDEPYLL